MSVHLQKIRLFAKIKDRADVATQVKIDTASLEQINFARVRAHFRGIHVRKSRPNYEDFTPSKRALRAKKS